MSSFKIWLLFDLFLTSFSFYCSVGNLDHPYSLAVDPSTGLLYIAEYWAHRIAVMDPTSGEVVRTIGVGYGESSRQLFCPNGLALDAHGNLLVADRANNRVVVFNAADGEYVAHFPTPSDPYFIFVGSQGEVVVSGGFSDACFVCMW